MSTKILVITHENFSHLVYEVMETLKLPIELKLLEVGFGEVSKHLDLEMISNYDMVITSGAHFEMIKRDFNELLYIAPFFPLHFTESDLVKALVQAKKFSDKIILMYFSDEEYDLEKYKDILNIELIRLTFTDLAEAQKLIELYKNKGYHAVIGTSSICELARSLGCYDILVYTSDSLKLELIKACQLATTRNKMMKYAKLKDAIFKHSNHSIFLLNSAGTILDVNEKAKRFPNNHSKYEFIGENIDLFLKTPVFSTEDESFVVDKPIIHVFEKENVQETTIPIYINSVLDGYVTIIDSMDQHRSIANIQTSKTLKSKYQFKDIVAKSPLMKKVILRSRQYAHSDAPILIYGESGTGKELIAHGLHEESRRKNKSFVPVNCAAIPQSILESELFGYEEGTFTGAKKGGKPGFFEMAQGGTIFLDEIGEIPLETQTRLLRVLQEKEIIPLGGRNIIPLDVRIITATNRYLPESINQGTFREDLYYRINILQIILPPLRERKEDILPIFLHLLTKHGIPVDQAEYLTTIGAEAFLSYGWRGNIRELENFVLRLTALTSIATTTYDLVNCFNDVLSELFRVGEEPLALTTQPTSPQSPVSLTYNETERHNIMKALAESNGSKSKTANKLGISRTTLWRKIKELNIILR